MSDEKFRLAIVALIIGGLLCFAAIVVFANKAQEERIIKSGLTRCAVTVAGMNRLEWVDKSQCK